MMNTRDEFADLLTQLSDACIKHKDELVARKNYYSDIDKKTRKTSSNYFKDNPFLLEPVPNALVSVLSKLNEYQLQNIGTVIELGADLIFERIENLLSDDQAFIDKITPNIHFLYDYLSLYNDCVLRDGRYHFFNYMGATIGSKWLSFDNRKVKDLPVFQANEERMLNQEIMTLQIEQLELSEDEEIKRILAISNLPAEAKLKQIHIQQMTKQLEEYYDNLEEETVYKNKINDILLALQDNNSSPSTVIENAMHAIRLALPDLEEGQDTAGIKILKAFACIFSLGIAALFIYDTKGAALARDNLSTLKKLSTLNFFQKDGKKQAPAVSVDKQITRQI